MVGKFEGKVVLITGGTSGIGLSSAKLFASEGARVFLTGRRQAALDTAVEEVGNGSVGIQGDVANIGDLDRVCDRIQGETGRLDVLFANAGTAKNQILPDITEATYEDTFNTNVKGVLFSVQKTLPLMSDGAAVVVNASAWTIKGVEGFALLNASKAAVRSFVRTWANELRHRRIRVNAVSPGFVMTPAIERATGGIEAAKALMDKFAQEIPVGKVAQPEDIAKIVAFLASDDAAFVNGVELFADGRMTQI